LNVRQPALPFGKPQPPRRAPPDRREGVRGAAKRREERGGRRKPQGRGRRRPVADPAAEAREALRRRQFERLMERLRSDAAVIASHFGLRYRALLIERPTARSHYGVCYQDGTIKIRLNHAVYLRPLRYSSLINTVCHELTHLRHFDHGEGFKRFYAEILEWARARRIYRPAGRRPEQAVLLWAPAESCQVDSGTARVWLKMMRHRLDAGAAKSPAGAASTTSGTAKAQAGAAAGRNLD